MRLLPSRSPRLSARDPPASRCEALRAGGGQVTRNDILYNAFALVQISGRFKKDSHTLDSDVTLGLGENIIDFFYEL